MCIALLRETNALPLLTLCFQRCVATLSRHLGSGHPDVPAGYSPVPSCGCLNPVTELKQAAEKQCTGCACGFFSTCYVLYFGCCNHCFWTTAAVHEDPLRWASYLRHTLETSGQMSQEFKKFHWHGIHRSKSVKGDTTISQVGVKPTGFILCPGKWTPKAVWGEGSEKSLLAAACSCLQRRPDLSFPSSLATPPSSMPVSYPHPALWNVFKSDWDQIDHLGFLIHPHLRRFRLFPYREKKYESGCNVHT